MADKLISNAPNISAVQFKESSAPITPSSGYGKVYAKTDGNLYWKNDAGTEKPLPFYEGCFLTDGSSQTIGNGSFTSISFDSEVYDTGGLHDTVTNNSRVTIVEDGIYSLVGSCRFASNASGVRGVGFQLGGVTYYPKYVPALSGITTDVSQSRVQNFVTGNIVEFAVYQDSGGNLDISLQHFAVQRIG